MGETPSTGPQHDAGIDLSQFYQVFFEEAGENLERMEKLLLGLDLLAADDEELNAVFRCAHSIKGGAATFGFVDVAELTHQMETLLDKLRRHELAPTGAMVDVLLQAGDALRAQLARHQGAGGDAVDTAGLLHHLRALAASPPTLPQPAASPVADRAPPRTDAPAPAPAAQAMRELVLRVGPLKRPADADDLQELFSQIPDLGRLVALDGGHATDGIRRFQVSTTSSDADLLDLFTFHVARELLHLQPQASQPVADVHANPKPIAAAPPDPGYGFFENAPGAPANAGAAAMPPVAPGAAAAPPAPAAPAAPAVSAPPTRRADRAQSAGPEAATLRVSVEKVDQLINLVGELVITRAMLAQNSHGLDPALQRQMAASLAELERNTRDLQASVMSIRMIPMSVVFSRFPRMLRDLAAKLGKQVDFLTQGEATELDKGLVEKITDPLTHLVRNSCDHGIELPAERRARGKPEQGTITLAATHQGGSIVIEVRDDGRGLSRPKLLKKARERGIDAPDSLPDSDVWNLIFAPGFSTADVVTDVSGRGVGMDVVKRNIAALGGTVEIESAEGYGMRVAVRLPLTLAIMDGMSIGVGDEVYIVPLSSVVESFQVRPGTIKTLGGTARVVEVRGQIVPVLELERVFAVPRAASTGADPGIVVVVEAEAGRVALQVDRLCSQQQVVVKNLETNYRRVDHVSGATILGDGRVALILDVASLVGRSRH